MKPVTLAFTLTALLVATSLPAGGGSASADVLDPPIVVPDEQDLKAARAPRASTRPSQLVPVDWSPSDDELNQIRQDSVARGITPAVVAPTIPLVTSSPTAVPSGGPISGTGVPGAPTAPPSPGQASPAPGGQSAIPPSEVNEVPPPGAPGAPVSAAGTRGSAPVLPPPKLDNPALPSVPNVPVAPGVVIQGPGI